MEVVAKPETMLLMFEMAKLVTSLLLLVAMMTK
jgi:hypothetical protein